MLTKTLLRGRAWLGAEKRHTMAGHLASSRSGTRQVFTSSTTVRQQQQQQQQQQRASGDSRACQAAAKPPSQLEPRAAQARLANLEVWHSVDTIKRLGHRLAELDPLRMKPAETLEALAGWSHPLLDVHLSDERPIETQGFLNTSQARMSVGELVKRVYAIYAANNCGLEFGHLSNQVEIEWLTSQWEHINETFQLSQVAKQNLARLLLECETFDHFLATKFPTTKRYGCEGAEPMILVVDELLRLCQIGPTSRSGMSELEQAWLGRIDDVIIGMPHRGRLNLLACLLDFEPAAIFSKARGEPELDLREAWMACGDVLSHLSTNVRFVYGLDKQNIGLSRDSPEPLNVSLLPNPSHLEISSPMVAGSARGRAHNKQHGYSPSPKFAPSFEVAAKPSDRQHYEAHFKQVLPLQIHGDAALAGQGIIQETLQMANLPMFTVGGSVHLVVNNQIGYTTDSSLGRSSRYCTDVFKLIEAPVIHVNSDNIEAVLRATRLALLYRQRFGKDIAIDLMCYRKHGHNELDEPSFTQPLMYDQIRARKSTPQRYCDQIGLDQSQRQQIVSQFREKLNESYKRTDSFKPDNDNYRNFNLTTEYLRDNVCTWRTGCDLDMLRSVALASVETPADFKVHPNLARVLVADRRTRFNSQLTPEQVKVDWASSEILAFGSLLRQNHSVRIAGQDVARGTFSTRHACLFDQRDGRPFVPLNHMMSSEPGLGVARLEVANTILSEEAALAYEFGYSAETCELAIWEAQFGDFFNTAQSIIDTLVSSSEIKWLKQSALTLLLPHGLDGAGPEHSSSHIERFLQLSSSSASRVDTEARVNWSICFPTLPSQYFHLLRRQVLRPMRKPLVVMSPKVIFRHPDCISSLAELGPDSCFEPVLDDPTVSRPASVNTLVLCSGKVYFTLKELKLKLAANNVALVRLEELCPFPASALAEVLKRYPNVEAHRFAWLQEEHKNQGAYGFVAERLRNLANIQLNYLGRLESELPATGSSVLHKRELEQLLADFRAFVGANSG